MRHFLLTAALAFACFSLQAQQYGHLNFGNLIAQMPGTEAADKELETYGKQLTKQGEEMVNKLRQRVTDIETQVDDLPPVELEKLRAELDGERQKIMQFERQMQSDVARKRQELLGPILETARAAVTQVAEEKGYLLVFDTSQFNTVLYAEDAVDLMPLVKAKLGL
ncbi:OmpH family outer membrane protein [Lewinella sp. IMCC34183]|uniref:OmpH family outer membrane protein n=1 Tax=Lewinella sp. IMCC34183 TaxID=2248762 RepID=UPI000E23D885|nr:OmpH family outer membrane protein [Lewinella sp. IMCC34183]